MFKKEDIAEYYDRTQNHYETWWDLEQTHALHYGIWSDGIKNLKEATLNTNKVMMDLAGVKDGERILDAGCGIGGAAVFLATQKAVDVTGVTLSQRQLNTANALADKTGMSNRVRFHIMDYMHTTFADQSFDVVWACESVLHCADKSLFIKEAYRLLKPGGRLILCDFFLTDANQADPNKWIEKWVHTWAVPGLSDMETFSQSLVHSGFKNIDIRDYTKAVTPSAKRMSYAGWLGMIPSEVYAVFHPNVSQFAKNHYKCGIYQYKALKAGLWKYKVVLASK